MRRSLVKYQWEEFRLKLERVKKLIEITLKLLNKFSFKNCAYTLGGEIWGPIRTRLTISVDRLALQIWSEELRDILKVSNIAKCLCRISVDDGKNFIGTLRRGTRYSVEDKKF